MDCCKAISIAARYDGDVWEDFWKRPGVFDFEPLPLGVIVTVAGTGSECNGGAVITNEELKIKTGRDYPQCNPKFALLDPTYTYSVPKKQMVSGSFDILSHIMEIKIPIKMENIPIISVSAKKILPIVFCSIPIMDWTANSFCFRLSI